MCGILGYIGDEPAQPILIECLDNISYRGYDSCGLALIDESNLVVERAVGGVAQLRQRIQSSENNSRIGIAHTRWATHGAPTEQNAHPHRDCTGRIAVVHNGIIDNFEELKHHLIALGHRFWSDTDTEVVPHLIEQEMQNGADFSEAVRLSVKKLEGSFAIVAIHADRTNQLIASRRDCPLVIGIGNKENLFSSDMAAIADRAERFVVLDNDRIATIRTSGVKVEDLDGCEVPFNETFANSRRQRPTPGKFDNFLLKEIHDQPESVAHLLDLHLSSRSVESKDLVRISSRSLEEVVLVGCGSASFACLYGSHIFHELTPLRARAEVASELRYENHSVTDKTLVIVVSQSGETADSIAALRMSKGAGAITVGVVNVIDSTIAREADVTLYTNAGVEAAVPSTKAFLSQMVVLNLLAAAISQSCGTAEEARKANLRSLRRLPEAISKVLEERKRFEHIATNLNGSQSWFVIGRGVDQCVAQEAALKLKEVAYVHAEALVGGELKHGPISLIDPGMPVLGFITQPKLAVKTLNNLQEVVARQANVICVTNSQNNGLGKIASDIFVLPTVHPLVAPIVSILPAQMIAYYCGMLRGVDVDRPRNLAKSVTVE